MGMFDTIHVKTPLICPTCAAEILSLQTKELSDSMAQFKIGSVLKDSPVLTGIVKETLWCSRVPRRQARTNQPARLSRHPALASSPAWSKTPPKPKPASPPWTASTSSPGSTKPSAKPPAGGGTTTTSTTTCSAGTNTSLAHRFTRTRTHRCELAEKRRALPTLLRPSRRNPHRPRPPRGHPREEQTRGRGSGRLTDLPSAPEPDEHVGTPLAGRAQSSACCEAQAPAPACQRVRGEHSVLNGWPNGSPKGFEATFTLPRQSILRPAKPRAGFPAPGHPRAGGSRGFSGGES